MGTANATDMKRASKLALGLAALVVVLALFLLPIIPIQVSPTDTPSCATKPPVDVYPCTVFFEGSARASVMYAYLGMGTVQIANSSSYAYCLVYGNPGTMCGQPVQRMNQMTAP